MSYTVAQITTKAAAYGGFSLRETALAKTYLLGLIAGKPVPFFTAATFAASGTPYAAHSPREQAEIAAYAMTVIAGITLDAMVVAVQRMEAFSDLDIERAVVAIMVDNAGVGYSAQQVLDKSAFLAPLSDFVLLTAQTRCFSDTAGISVKNITAAAGPLGRLSDRELAACQIKFDQFL